MNFTVFAEKVLGLRLTAGQRVFARVAFDGAEPGELDGEDGAIAERMFGGVVQFPHTARGTIVLRCGRASGKSTLCSAHAVYRLVTAQLGSCGPGDVPAVVVVSPRLKTSKIALGMSLAMVEREAMLRKMLRTSNAEGFSLQRKDGKRTQLVSIPKSRGGAAGRGYSIVEAMIDESEFVASGDPELVITDAQVISSLMPRAMEGCLLLLASTPWPAPSATAELFDRNFGHPENAVCAFAPTHVMRDDPAILEMIDRERRRDPANALREYDCKMVDSEGSFFEQSSIELAQSDSISITRTHASAGADYAFRWDSSGLAIVERQGDRVVLVRTELVSPAPNAPLVPSDVISRFATIAREHNAGRLSTDPHYIESVREHSRGIQVIAGPTGHDARVKAFTYVRDLFREGKIVIHRDSRLVAQLRSVQARPQAGGGLAISMPRAAGAGHADLVSALVNAVWIDRMHGKLGTDVAKAEIQGPKPYRGMQVVQNRGGFQRW